MKPSYILGVELLAIGQKTLLKANRRFLACQHCDTEASTPFEWILQEVLDQSENHVEYLLSEPAKCPKCASPVYESTLVQPDAAFERNQNEPKIYLPPLESTNFVFIDEATLHRAQSQLAGCEHCCEEAEISLDYILDDVTGCDPQITEYLLCHSTTCPECFSEVTEKTLVIPNWA
jgi:hypothetical protein